MREFEAFIAVQECALSASREVRVERLRIDRVPGPNVPFPPMEALLVEDLPTGDRWQYEPKWDGFRGVLENDGC